jgi:hypothetical protein
MRREYEHKPVNQISHRHISRATKMTRIARQNRGDSATQERITGRPMISTKAATTSRAAQAKALRLPHGTDAAPAPIRSLPSR